MPKKQVIWAARAVEVPQFDRGRVERWLEAVAAAHDRILGELCYVFVDDEGILKINREFLSHDYYTDIITFDYSRRRMVSGDIYISLDTVATNAVDVGAGYDRELLRVVVHGLLHLCGINDKGPGEREIMEAHEDAALAMFDKL